MHSAHEPQDPAFLAKPVRLRNLVCEAALAAADKLTLVLEGLDLFGATGQWLRTDPAPATRSIPTTRAMSSSRTGWLRRLVGQTVLSKNEPWPQ